MRKKKRCIAAARIVGAIALATWASGARPVFAMLPGAMPNHNAAFAPVVTAVAADSWGVPAGLQFGADAARGSGFLSWWRGHGKEVAEAIGCALDGAALGRMVALGMTAVGGALAAAGLAAAALACLA